MVAGLSATMVAWILIDVSIMNHRYAGRYNELDQRAVKPGTNPMYSGFAKLLSWDYDMERRWFIHKDMSRLNQHTADCIRYIFLAFADRLRNSWTVITVLTFLLNFTMLIAGVVEYMLPFNTYFRIQTPEYYATFSLALIIIIGIINITVLLKTNEHYDKITLFKYLPGAGYQNDDEIIRTYHHYHDNGTIMNLDVDRGVYKYNCTHFEKGKLITDIFPEDDRMIFFFRQYSRISRVTMIVWTLCLFFVCIVVWHCHILWGLLAIPVTAVCNVALVAWILPYIDGRRIGGIIEENHLAEEKG